MWHGPLSHWCREGKTLVVRPLKKHYFLCVSSLMDMQFLCKLFKASNKMEAYTSKLCLPTRSSVRIMLFYPFSSLSPGPRLVFLHVYMFWIKKGLKWMISKEKRLWMLQIYKFLTDTQEKLHKIFLHILSFQNILPFFFLPSRVKLFNATTRRTSRTSSR